MIVVWFLFVVSFFVLIALGTFKIFWRFIENKPPHVGVITMQGVRKPKFKKEGWHFFADFWPVFYGFIPINIERKTLQIIVQDVRCRSRGSSAKDPRSGGEVQAEWSIIYQPDFIHNDGARLIDFLDSGGHDGVEEKIKNLVEGDSRQFGRSHHWEDFTFSTDQLVKKLVKKLTGEDLKNLSVEDLPDALSKNGFPDIKDFGVIFWRISLDRVKEQGQLAERANFLALEEQERMAEVFEMDTEIKLAVALHEAYKTHENLDKPLEECILEIRRRKAIREGHGTVIDLSGLSGPVAAILGSIVKGGGSHGTS